MLSLWQRLPVVVRAVLAGSAVSAAGILPWVVFATWNQKRLVSVPWAVLPTALYVWLFWRHLQGAGWPQATADARRTGLRANRLSGDVWGMALFAGVLGLSALVPLLGVLSRLVRLPAESQPIVVLPQMPLVTVFFLLVMASVVLTNSILPGLVLHAGGDVFSLTRLWATGKPEWQTSSAPPQLIWESGSDPAFWGYLAAFFVVGAAAVWAYATLASVLRDATQRSSRALR